MLNNIIYTLPELSIFFGIINLCILNLLGKDSSKQYGYTAKLWLLVSLLFSILFYNKSYNITYFENTSYTLLFRMLVIIFSYILLSLAPTWFATENKTGCKFFVLFLSAIIVSNLLISSINIISIISCYSVLIYINYRLFAISYDKYPSEAATRYIGISAIIILLFSIGVYTLLLIYNLPPNLKSIADYINNKDTFITEYICVILILLPFLFSLGLVPFHIVAEDKVSKTILPVSHYFAIIAPITFFAAFIKLNSVIFSQYEDEFSISYTIIGLATILFGALGANARINLYRIYAYGTMFNFGVVMILFSMFTQSAYFTGFLYLLIYLLSLNGIYIIFYGLRSRGEFLSSITSISGLSKSKPFLTNCLLISLFSAMGFPPLVGFISQFSYISEILSDKSYIVLGVILICFLVLAKSYLEIIKTIYFEPKIKKYDTESKVLLFYIVLNIIILNWLFINPHNVLEKIKDMFNVIYI